MKRKRILLSLFFIFGFISLGFSQDWSFGLKAGINHSFAGYIQGNPRSNTSDWDGIVEGTGKMGFQGGAFLQRDFGRFFLRGEVVYISLESEFDIPNSSTPSIYAVEKFEVPILLGYNLIGPLDIYAGPSYSNILTSVLRGTTSPADVTVQNTPITGQAGIKVQFGRLGLDLRYVHSLSTAESQPLSFNPTIYDPANGGAYDARFLDARLNYVSLGVFFELGGTNSNDRSRNRKTYCYW